eukprot:scaffold21663_cov148-Skeletonema_dohrnii-CCMP3373.AAC.3
MYEEVAFLRLLSRSFASVPFHQSKIHNMQHDMSFYRRHGETVLDSIANQHRLSNFKSKLFVKHKAELDAYVTIYLPDAGPQ